MPRAWPTTHHRGLDGELIAWGAIGARTTESQFHGKGQRQLGELQRVGAWSPNVAAVSLELPLPLI